MSDEKTDVWTVDHSSYLLRNGETVREFGERRPILLRDKDAASLRAALARPEPAAVRRWREVAEPEPGEHIVDVHCPCCGERIRIQHGDDPDEIGALGPISEGDA